MGRLKAGPKAAIELPPLDFSGWPQGRAARRLRFIANYCVTPKGKGARKPFVVRPFQRDIIKGAYAKGVRTALVSLPRANGKTGLAAALAVAELFVNLDTPEVLIVASDQRQAGICFKAARRMIELNSQLADRCHIYKDRIEVPDTGGTLMALPADPAALHGWDPALLIVDELHVVTEAVWEAVTSMQGKRPESLTLAISTPATSPDCVMHRLVEHGRAGEDKAFFFAEFSAPEGCDTKDRAAWRIANPALSCRSPFLAEDGLEAAERALRPEVFRQLRLGQWVSGHGAWLPLGAWDALAASREVSGSEPVVLAFDGSASGDSTALIGCTVSADPYIWVQGLWENPNDKRWRVPRQQVDDAVAAAFDRFDVVELAADPWGWRSELETWAERHGEQHVIEWNTGERRRMAPATDRLYQAIKDGSLIHDGNPHMSAHMAHCVAVSTTLGDVVMKDRRNSPRKIDAAVAAIVAYDRAAWHLTNKKPTRKVWAFK